MQKKENSTIDQRFAEPITEQLHFLENEISFLRSSKRHGLNVLKYHALANGLVALACSRHHRCTTQKRKIATTRSEREQGELEKSSGRSVEIMDQISGTFDTNNLLYSKTKAKNHYNLCLSKWKYNRYLECKKHVETHLLVKVLW